MDYKRGRPAKRRRGGPSVDEVKDSIDKKESEKQQRKAEKRTIGIEQKNTPKLKSTNIKSIFNNNNFSLGKVGQGGTSKIGTLTKIVRKNRISINSLVKDKVGQDKKISIIKNIIKNQQSKIGQKIPGSDQDNLYKTLVETNKLLIDIQKQLVKSISKETKDSLDAERREGIKKSKKKLKTEENLLEKTGKSIGIGVKKVADKMLSPIKNIFDKITDFLLTLGTGIAVNGVFEWLKSPKNVETVKGWFGWIKDNWKWMAVAVGAFTLLPVVSSILTVLGPLKILIALIAKAVPLLIGFLVNPLTLKALLAIGAGVLIYKAGEWAIKKIRENMLGGKNFAEADDQLNQKLKDAGMTSAGVPEDRSRQGNRNNTKNRTEEQEKIFKEVEDKRKQLDELKNDMEEKITKKQREIDYTKFPDKPGDVGAMGTGTGSNRDAERLKVKKEVEESYIPKIETIIDPREIETMKMGGPVKSGKPYIVGDQLGMKTAELFVPKQDGTIINNTDTNKIIGNLKQKNYNTIPSMGKKVSNIKTMEFPPIIDNTKFQKNYNPIPSGGKKVSNIKTIELPTIINNDNNKIINNLKSQKIYNTISSKRKKGTNIKTMEFPPIFNNDTDIPEISVPSAPATRVPSISSFDASNPYIKTSLDIYGIIV